MRCGPNTLHMQVSSHITMECHQANGRAVCRVCIRQEEAQRQDQLRAMAERMKRHIGGDVPGPGMGYEEDELTL